MGLTEWVADTLSVLTILSCGFMKVPQIQHLRQARNADGLMLQAMIMEISGYTTMTLYNYTNSYSLITYLEYPLILLQSYILLYYTLKYKRKLYRTVTTASAVTYWTIVVCFVTGILPSSILTYLTPLCTPLSGMSKVMYIVGIIMDGNADAVSLTTWVISIATNLARIFTVYTDSKDFNLMTNFTISTILSTGVLVTAIIFKCGPEPPPPCPPDLPRSRRKSTHVD
ncbi:uncharacterized protein LOC134678759 [Cydia fagiglandana]|uniref:uncharacterized protein LOC134678759 n=1 Tax=Cydia fagiglandana TaxID=1458189 RepID=UPI002FEE3C4F